MKKTIGHLIIVAMLVAAGAPAFAQQTTAKTPPQKEPEKYTEQEKLTSPDRAVVPLSNPAKPAKIEASVMRGSITVKGYEGKEVIAEASIRERAVSEYRLAEPYFREAQKEALEKLKKSENLAQAKAQESYRMARALGSREQEKQERSHEGMKLITAAMTGLTVEEDNNTVTVSTDSWKYGIDLTLQVPYASSLELTSSSDGKITVENVTGELEINGANGFVTLRNVSGNAVVHTMNGDIEAVLSKVSPDKPLSFSNMNGDIDITLPADIKATVKMKSQIGNIYSDFDVVLKTRPPKADNVDVGVEKGRYRVTFDKGIVGTINGGGQEITLTTFNGDIFIRKKK